MIMFVPPSNRHNAVQRFVGQLLVADWNDPAGVMRLNDRLPLSELGHASFFHDARCLLKTLEAAGGTPATVAGNLNRSFVRSMFDLVIMPQLLRRSIYGRCKAFNEQDLPALHFARVVCECGRLLARRHRRFVVTRRGRTLLPDEQAGALYRHLFVAYIRRFNLGYRFPFRDVPGIQETMAVILWRLGSVARKWTPVQGLAEQVLIPSVYAELRTVQTYPHDTDAWILAGYVLNPLIEFGLIEKRHPGEWPGCGDKDAIRTTALFHHFIDFSDEP
ncbi:MAG: hypothetical protein QME66_04825 [Candidatus Eisenbacteria bacterium]|nr:hypothetical protein [Candidatus Eisenbacteria bacterium]